MGITFPPEIIVDIFSKLPVKSLCRFKCLSKSFHALIAHPKFAEMHLSQTKTQKFLTYNSFQRSFYSVDYETSYHSDEVVAVKLDFPVKNKRRSRWVSIFGSCKGLVLLRSEPKPYATYIYNPSINEYKQIPDDHGLGIQHMICHDYVFGFGYAQPIDDYKVVKFCTCEAKIVYIFTLRNNSWKRVELEHVISRYTYNKGGIFLNGDILWLVIGDDGEYKIVAFDLLEENFKTVPFPTVIPEYFHCSIGVLGDCLFLLVGSPNCEINIWIMKKYNMRESWYAISMDEDHPFSCLTPLSYLHINSEIMVALDDTKLVFYNPTDETFKELASRKISHTYQHYSDVYQETLVSPNYNNNNFTEKMVNNYSSFIMP